MESFDGTVVVQVTEVRDDGTSAHVRLTSRRAKFHTYGAVTADVTIEMPYDEALLYPLGSEYVLKLEPKEA